MLKTDPLVADVERDLFVFKQHLNPIVRVLEEAAERQQFAVPVAAAPPPAAPPAPMFGDEGMRVAQSYMGLLLRPLAPSAWFEFWAASAALQAASLRSLLR
jgi:hypothetical protein